MTNSVWVIGCGDIGRRVAASYQPRGFALHGLVRSAHSAAQLQAQGITAHCLDLDQPQSIGSLDLGDALVFYFAPPPASGMTDTRMHHFIQALDPKRPPAQVIYLSTSAVYGDNQGAWVTETTPPQPGGERGQRRLDAERQLSAWSAHSRVPIVILRVGGIYGPGRLPVERIRRRLPVLKPEECGYTNRIHADDLARVCSAAAARGRAGEIYNVSDGHPSTMTDYFYRIADHYQLPRPPAISWAEAQTQLSAEMLSYLKESRRLDNRKMLRELGVSLHYPDLAAGLAAIPSQDCMPTKTNGDDDATQRTAKNT